MDNNLHVNEINETTNVLNGNSSDVLNEVNANTQNIENNNFNNFQIDDTPKKINWIAFIIANIVAFVLQFLIIKYVVKASNFSIISLVYYNYLFIMFELLINKVDIEWWKLFIPIYNIYLILKLAFKHALEIIAILILLRVSLYLWIKFIPVDSYKLLIYSYKIYKYSIIYFPYLYMLKLSINFNRNDIIAVLLVGFLLSFVLSKIIITLLLIIVFTSIAVSKRYNPNISKEHFKLTLADKISLVVILVYILYLSFSYIKAYTSSYEYLDRKSKTANLYDLEYKIPGNFKLIENFSNIIKYEYKDNSSCYYTIEVDLTDFNTDLREYAESKGSGYCFYETNENHIKMCKDYGNNKYIYYMSNNTVKYILSVNYDKSKYSDNYCSMSLNSVYDSLKFKN